MKRFSVVLVIIVAFLAVSFAQAAATFTSGQLQLEFWQGKVKGDVEGGTAGVPDSVQLLPLFEWPADGSNEAGDNYAIRVTGFFIPPTTGNYIIFVDSDDTSDLYLSTDDTPANKRLIAQQPGWSNQLTWQDDNGGGTDLAQRRSDSWSPDGGTTVPFKDGISLVAGTHYYIEGVMNEFGGGDNFAATFKLVGETDPADGDSSKMTGNLIGTSLTPATIFVITNQPQNVTVHAGTIATFSVGLQTDAKVNGNPLPPSYQWRRGGTNIVDATTPTTSFFTSDSDNGAKIDVVITFPASSGLTNTATSSAATLTVSAGLTVSGKLKQEMWVGNTARGTVETGSAGTPTTVSEFTSFHAPVNVVTPAGGDFTFARRVSGYFTPATSGNYVFFVCSDDDSDLFLSTDDSPANKRLIAREAVWSNDLQWTTSGGASDVTLKRSDQFSPDGGTTKPFSAGITLVAGTKYYIEGVEHEGGGGDDFSATFKLLADADPADGDAPKLTNGVISYVTSPVTSGTISTQPQNVTVFESQSFTLSVVVQTDSELTPIYQWRKGGVNIPGPFANAATYTVAFANAASDAGSYDCVITIPNFATVLTSTAATVTINTAPFVTGYLKYEYFPGSDRPTVEGGTAGAPHFDPAATVGSGTSGAAISFESGVNFADNYANRFSGFFVPPTTGDYVFFVASDDDSDLFLSTDDKPANKRMIAQEAGWSNNRSWSTIGGTSTPEQKRSDSFSPDAGVTVPFAAGIHLVAGTHYYIEGVHHEGGGGDNFSATFKLIADADPADGDATTLIGNVIGVLVPPQTITFTTQPQSTSTQVGQVVTLAVGATTDGFYPPSYQWKKNGTDIAGATLPTYSFIAAAADNNAQFLAAVSLLGSSPTNSQTATLTVTSDTTAPTVLEANGTAASVSITFSEPMDAASAGNAANYSINNGVTVNSATVTNIASGTFAASVVKLAVSGATAGKNYAVTISGVKDLAGNPVSTTESFDAYSAYYDFNDGQVPVGTAIAGSATNLVTGGPNGTGILQMTQAAGSLQGGFSIPDLANGAQVTSFTATFKLFIGKATALPADGFSFNYGTDLAATTSTSEEGSGAGLTVEIDTYDNSVAPTPPEAPAIDVKWGGTEIATNIVAESALVTDSWVDVTIQLNSDGTLTVIHNGKTYYDHLDLKPAGYAPMTAPTFLLGARTGGSLEELDLDNLAIVENAGIVVAPPNAKLTVTKSGSNLNIAWSPTGGRLQSTAAFVGSATVWADVGSSNPATVPLTGSSLFLRVINP